MNRILDRDFPFKKGDYVHNGYSRMRILDTSPLKGFIFVVKIDPTQKDCIGAWKMRGSIIHLSYRATMDLKKWECI